MKKPSRDRITDAALILQQRNYSDVAKWLLAQDIKIKPKTTQARVKRVDVADRNGDRARGGSRAYIPQALIEAALREAAKPMSDADEQALARASEKAKAIFPTKRKENR